jgi:hypothetical protein
MDALAKKIEGAKRIVKEESCANVGCMSCPAGDVENCNELKGGTLCEGGESRKKALEWFRDWLSKNDPAQKEIIGWPGNVDEMRQYIDNLVLVKDKWDQDWLDIPRNLRGVDYSDQPYITGCNWRYIKVLHKPTITELTREDIAKKFDIPVDQLRIKE